MVAGKKMVGCVSIACFSPQKSGACPAPHYKENLSPPANVLGHFSRLAIRAMYGTLPAIFGGCITIPSQGHHPLALSHHLNMYMCLPIPIALSS